MAPARKTARSSPARRRPEFPDGRPGERAAPALRGPAIVAAFAFGFGASLLRLAFGGHYLSDVLLGGLITLIVIEVVRPLIWPRDAFERELLRRPGFRGVRRKDASGRIAG